MQKRSRANVPSATATVFLSLLLIICLTEGASGSCLSYGHSCWGAHGKRSGIPPASAPDWYITKMLQQIAENNYMNREKNSEISKNEVGDIYRVVLDNTRSTTQLGSDLDEVPNEFSSKLPEAKPMLDDDILSKLKLWQIMRVASQEN